MLSASILCIRSSQNVLGAEFNCMIASWGHSLWGFLTWCLWSANNPRSAGASTIAKQTSKLIVPCSGNALEVRSYNEIFLSLFFFKLIFIIFLISFRNLTDGRLEVKSHDRISPRGIFISCYENGNVYPHSNRHIRATAAKSKTELPRILLRCPQGGH